MNGTQRFAFRAGDVMFAAAGEVHRFEEFSEDFFTWVLFYGPRAARRLPWQGTRRRRRSLSRLEPAALGRSSSFAGPRKDRRVHGRTVTARREERGGAVPPPGRDGTPARRPLTR